MNIDSDGYVHGVKVPFYDTVVSQIIEDCQSPFGGGGNSMRIGVLAEDGETVYRVHVAIGMGEWMEVVSELKESGFIDLIQDKTHPTYDALFAPSPELLAEAPPPQALVERPCATEDLETAADELRSLQETERSQVVLARVGQGCFREGLMDAFASTCALTGFSFAPALRASHIKPWRESTNAERLSADNGLLLRADIDALFDGGHISFDDDGALLVSSKLPASEAASIGLSPALRLRDGALTEARRQFLSHHRATVFGAR